MIRFERFDNPAVITVEEASPLADSLEAEVSRIWQSDPQVAAGNRFDGTLVSLVERDEGVWRCQKIPYRWFLAQRRKPSMYRDLKICMLAATGLVSCESGYLLGKRADFVEQDPGMWEFLPAGGVDEAAITSSGTVNLLNTFHAEWQEETGCSPEFIEQSAGVVAYIEDQKNRVIDLIIQARCTVSFQQVKDCFQKSGSNEYDEISCLSSEEISKIDKMQIAEISRMTATELLLK